MRLFLNRLFEATGYLAGLFMIGTLLAVLSSIFGRFLPALEVHGADAYAGYCMAASAFLALASTLPLPTSRSVVIASHFQVPLSRYHW